MPELTVTKDMSDLECAKFWKSEKLAKLRAAKAKEEFEKVHGPRWESLYVNCLDVFRNPGEDRERLLLGRVWDMMFLEVDANDPRERCFEFSCDLLTAAGACDQFRKIDEEHGRPPTRVVLWCDRGHVKVPGDVRLTVDGMGEAMSPELFPWVVVKECAPKVVETHPPIPLAAVKISFTKR